MAERNEEVKQKIFLINVTCTNNIVLIWVYQK